MEGSVGPAKVLNPEGRHNLPDDVCVQNISSSGDTVISVFPWRTELSSQFPRTEMKCPVQSEVISVFWTAAALLV